MNCQNCNESINQFAQFCGKCGRPVAQNNSGTLKPKELFSIEKHNSEPLNDVVDEFLEVPSAPVKKSDSESDDFFDEFSNPLTDDNQGNYHDERKIFGPEDDPNHQPENDPSEPKSSKKIDRKLLAKVRAKQRTKVSTFPKLISGFITIALLSLISIPPLLLVYKLEQNLLLKGFMLLPLGLLFIWPMLRKSGLTLNLIFKICNLWYCAAFVYVLILNKKAGISIDLFRYDWNGFAIQLDVWIVLHFYFIFFCQSILFYLWRSPILNPLKISLIPMLGYCLYELFTRLHFSPKINEMGGPDNLVTSALYPFIGDLGLYLAPHYVLTHVAIPMIISAFAISSVIRLFQKKWAQCMSNLLYCSQGWVFLAIYLLPYRNPELSAKIFSLGPIIDQVIRTVLSSVPLII